MASVDDVRGTYTVPLLAAGEGSPRPLVLRVHFCVGTGMCSGALAAGSAKLVCFRPSFAQFRPNTVQCLPNLARIRPDSGEVGRSWPNSALISTCPKESPS